MAIEMIFTEEDAKLLWNDEEFLSMIKGCVAVSAQAETTGGRKHLIIRPVSIGFERYGIDLGVDLIRELTQEVMLVTVPQPVTDR